MTVRHAERRPSGPSSIQTKTLLESRPVDHTDWTWQSDLLLARLELLVLLLRDEFLNGGIGPARRGRPACWIVRSLKDEQRDLLRKQVTVVEWELRPFMPRDSLTELLQREAGLTGWDAATIAHFHRRESEAEGAPSPEELARRTAALHPRLFQAAGSAFSLGAVEVGGISPLPLAILVAVVRKVGNGAGPPWMELEPEVERVLAVLRRCEVRTERERAS